MIPIEAMLKPNNQDMWNEKDYSHEGLGKIMKELNGDHLTKITQPPEDL